MSDTVIRTHADLIWRVADKLRGVYKQSEYGRVILPLTVLRRLDCVLEPTKDAVLAKHAGLRGKIENVPVVARRPVAHRLQSARLHRGLLAGCA